MPYRYHVDRDLIKKIDSLYAEHAIPSKELLVRMGIALGIRRNRSLPLSNPVPFSTIEEVDAERAFTVIAATRNQDVVTEEDVLRDLEEYGNWGMRELLGIIEKDGSLNPYTVYHRYLG